jgi:uncharacterized SAM-binding protein YcdF (DUF218 family)
VIRIAVVLGAAVWPGERPSPTLSRRALHAVTLYQRGEVDAILGCGGIGRCPPSEAEVIRRLCRAAGVPDSALITEELSTTTRENLLNAKPILDRLGAGAVIVTDRYHAPRARLVARQIGLSATISCPDWRLVGPRQWLRHVPREALACLATLAGYR